MKIIQRFNKTTGTRVLFLMGLLWGQAIHAASDLIISGVFDGPLTGGLPKGVEVYVLNPVADLSIYGLGSANNGGGTDGQEFTFPSAAASAGDFIYIATESVQFTAYFGFAPDHIHSAVNINGDDAVELFKNGSAVDVFGDVNTDGSGQPWEYMDGWAFRKDTATTPSTKFNLSDWLYSGPNALDGVLNNASAPNPVPQSSYLSSSAGITFTPSSADVSEAGSTADTYTLALKTTPASAVTITLSVADGETVISKDGATFAVSTTVTLSDTSAVTMTVKAVDDADIEGIHTGVISHAITTGDGEDYTAALSIADVTVNISDNDAASGGWVINEIHADPDASTGDANGDGSVNTTQDEFVEIINNTGTSVDISGWTLSDSVGVKYTFPFRSQIVDGCGVVVFAGGIPTGRFGNILVQKAGSLGLNNTGDTVSLNNGSADVASYTYGSEGGDNQSITRDPDITGSFVKHSTATGANGALFSPGTQADGSAFSGCPVSISTPNTEDFSDCSLSGWTIYSADADSSHTWSCGNGYVEVNALGGSVAADDWLISPRLDLDASKAELFSFDAFTQWTDTLSPDQRLNLYFSEDYVGEGDPSLAFWSPLSAIFDLPSENSQHWTFSNAWDTSSTFVPVDYLYIGFQYRSSGTSSGSATLWRVDNVMFKEADAEPSQYPTVFSAQAQSDTEITLTWTDAMGAVEPGGYVLHCNTVDSFYPQLDGFPELEGTDCDTYGLVYIAQGEQSYTWAGLNTGTQYFFKLVPYTNSGSSVDYKTDGSAPTANATTTTRDLLALWTFDSLTDVAHALDIPASTDNALDTPILQAVYQSILPIGMSGTAYTDADNVAHLPGSAVAWIDIKSSGHGAELWLTLNTTHWSALKLRFDYKTDSADSFDLEYSTDGGVSWTKPFNQEALIAAAGTYNSKTLDLSSETALNHQGRVWFKFSGFDNNGDDGLSLDNIEITGSQDSATLLTAPTLSLASSTSAFLSLNNTGMGFLNASLNDPSDPAHTLGIDWTLADPDTALGSLTLTASSSDQAVVADAGLVFSGTGSTRTLHITPSARGAADITVTLSDGTDSSTYVLAYRVSNVASDASHSRFHSGAADASAAIAIDANYMIIADDEDQILRIYDRQHSGMPVKSIDMNLSLKLEGQQKVDIEAVTRVGNTLYWLGSHSNDSSGAEQLDRELIFSTPLSGTGAATDLMAIDQYADLKTELEQWDSSNGHGLGADALGLTSSAADTQIPQANNGFSIEGLSMQPGSTTAAFLGFRAPLMNITDRNKALVIPVSNLTDAMQASPIQFAAPIFLNLGGRGIRSLECNANGCVILAGAVDSVADFALYTWSGLPADEPELRSVDLSGEGGFEAIVELPSGAFLGSDGDAQTLPVLRDNGDTDWYNTGAAKDLAQATWKKSQSDQLTLGAVVLSSCDLSTADTCIHHIQGDGMSSPLDGQIVTIEGIVTGDVQNGVGTQGDLGGFFVQEENTDVDNNALTSEGIFVYEGASPSVNVAVGDKVRITGTVAEYNDLTEITTVSTITIVNSGHSLPAASAVNLPLSDAAYLERFEGMRVNLPQTLTVTDTYNLARYGEILLANGRLDTPTQVATPGAAANALQAANDLNQILLDDGFSTQNPDPAPHGLTANHSIRGGDTVTGVTGLLHYGYQTYRLHPTASVSFTSVNPRPATPPSTGGSVTVASFNVLNYFTTLDGSGSICAPSHTLDCRGADSAAEFTRQRDKIIAAISLMNADIVGLMEVENTDASSGLADLVAGLNATMGAGTYAYVDTGTIGSDAIRVALIYKPASISLVGSHAILDNSVDARFIDTKNRPSLAQSFAQTASGEVLTVVVNHFKSKGSDCDALSDPDANDGQGNCNVTRTQAATALQTWVATDPTQSHDTDFLLLGDFNAYAQEDPITTLEAAGFTNETTGYSYVFHGQWGGLDHALSSQTLHAQVTGAHKWPINADEPYGLDYNMESRPSNLYNSDPYRASDHDPIIIGLNLNVSPIYASTPSAGSALSFTAETGTAASTSLTVTETGYNTLSISDYSITGTHADKFSFSPAFAAFDIVDGGSAQDLTLRCNSSEFGVFSATLSLDHNAAGSPATYTLSCTISESAASPTPSPATPDPRMFLSLQGSGQVSLNNANPCTQSCSSTYPSGTAITLEAQANSGWIFSEWEGACVSQHQDHLAQLIMSHARADCTARFARDPLADSDGDGVKDVEELTAPYTGDANQDGVTDDLQAHVLSVPDAVTGHDITIVAEPHCAILNAQADKPPTEADYAYPQGVIDVTVDCPQTILSLYFHGLRAEVGSAAAAGLSKVETQLRYQNRDQSWHLSSAVMQTTSTFDDNSFTHWAVPGVSVTLQDGGEDDLNADPQRLQWRAGVVYSRASQPPNIPDPITPPDSNPPTNNTPTAGQLRLLNADVQGVNKGEDIRLWVERFNGNQGELLATFEVDPSSTAQVGVDYELLNAPLMYWKNSLLTQHGWYLRILNDPQRLGEKTLILRLRVLSGQASIQGRDTLTLTLLDPPIAPEPSRLSLLEGNDYQVNERDTELRLLIQRQGHSQGELHARVNILPSSTAIEHEDFRFTQEPLLVWKDSLLSTKSLSIKWLDNPRVEPDKILNLQLEVVQGRAFIVAENINIVIHNDDVCSPLIPLFPMTDPQNTACVNNRLLGSQAVFPRNPLLLMDDRLSLNVYTDYGSLQGQAGRLLIMLTDGKQVWIHDGMDWQDWQGEFITFIDFDVLPSESSTRLGLEDVLQTPSDYTLFTGLRLNDGMVLYSPEAALSFSAAACRKGQRLSDGVLTQEACFGLQTQRGHFRATLNTGTYRGQAEAQIFVAAAHADFSAFYLHDGHTWGPWSGELFAYQQHAFLPQRLTLDIPLDGLPAHRYQLMTGWQVNGDIILNGATPLWLEHQ